MPLATAATGIGTQVVTHAVRTWLGARRERAERDAERMRPVYEHEFRDVAENERAAALLAVVDALAATELTDDTLFAVDVDARKLARLVRERVPVRRVGLAEPAERLYDAVLDESCMALVQVVRHLPAFTPRALAELLGRFSQVVGDIAEVLHRLPRTTLNAPAGSEHDQEFRARYLTHVSETLDELEQFGIDVRRYKPHTLVSVAYLSLQVSTDPDRRGRGDRPDERWFTFTEGRRTVAGGSSLRAEAALVESPRALLRGEAGSGKTTLLRHSAINSMLPRMSPIGCPRGSSGVSGLRRRVGSLITRGGRLDWSRMVSRFGSQSLSCSARWFRVCWLGRVKIVSLSISISEG